MIDGTTKTEVIDVKDVPHILLQNQLLADIVHHQQPQPPPQQHQQQPLPTAHQLIVQHQQQQHQQHQPQQQHHHQQHQQHEHQPEPAQQFAGVTISPQFGYTLVNAAGQAISQPLPQQLSPSLQAPSSHLTVTTTTLPYNTSKYCFMCRLDFESRIDFMTHIRSHFVDGRVAGSAAGDLTITDRLAQRLLMDNSAGVASRGGVTVTTATAATSATATLSTSQTGVCT